MRACVDIGGTKVAVSLSADSASPLIGRRSEPTAKTGDNDAVAVQIIRMIEEVCAAQGGAVAKVHASAAAARNPLRIPFFIVSPPLVGTKDRGIRP